MGILVPYATLAVGVTASNVYMSFTNEMVYVNQSSGKWRINSFYKVFGDRQQRKSNIRIDIATVTDKLDDPYSILYAELKKIYPDSIEVFEEGQVEEEWDTLTWNDRGQCLFREPEVSVGPKALLETKSYDTIVNGSLGEQCDAPVRSDSE